MELQIKLQKITEITYFEAKNNKQGYRLEIRHDSCFEGQRAVLKVDDTFFGGYKQKTKHLECNLELLDSYG